MKSRKWFLTIAATASVMIVGAARVVAAGQTSMGTGQRAAGDSRQPGPQATVTPEPTPTEAFVTLTGRLLPPEGTCEEDATLQLCDTARTVPVSSEVGGLDQFLGHDVKVTGVMRPCPTGGQSFAWLQTIEVLPGGCGTPSPTLPPPTPTPLPNLALGVPVVASASVPGLGPSNAVDGNPETLWYSPGQTAWILIDLGEERVFSEVVLHWGAPFATEYLLYAWRGSAWSGVYWQQHSDGGEDKFSLPRIFARYVLLYAVRSSDPADGYSLHEGELYGRETPNLAYGGAVEVSSFQEHCCPAWFVNDGDHDTRWSSQSGDRNPWIRMYFPPDTSVSEVRLYWDDAAFPWVFTVVLYNFRTGKHVEATLVAQEPGGGRQEFSVRSPIHADAVLLFSQQLSDAGYVALSEMEVYGPGGPGAAKSVGELVVGGNVAIRSWDAGMRSPAASRLIAPLDRGMEPPLGWRQGLSGQHGESLAASVGTGQRGLDSSWPTPPLESPLGRPGD